MTLEVGSRYEITDPKLGRTWWGTFSETHHQVIYFVNAIGVCGGTDDPQILPDHWRLAFEDNAVSLRLLHQ